MKNIIDLTIELFKCESKEEMSLVKESFMKERNLTELEFHKILAKVVE